MSYAHDCFEELCGGQDLSRRQARRLFGEIVGGSVPDHLLAGLLTAMKVKGETPHEVAGAADALLGAAAPFANRADEVLLDTCGTGGDGAQTVNVSTATAVLCAELGIAVVKHGNRSVSSRCGSADVLEQLGVNIASQDCARCLDEVRITFLFAPRFHAGVRHVMPARRGLRTRTIFNLLGPLVNPARPTHQLMGVYDPALCRPVAETLRELGTRAAFVVHGSGVDEVATHGPTHVARLRNGTITEFDLHPHDFGLQTHPVSALAGDDPEHNGRWLRRLLAGRGNEAHNTAVVLNAATALVLTERYDNYEQAAREAAEVLRSGAAARRLEQFAEVSHGAC